MRRKILTGLKPGLQLGLALFIAISSLQSLAASSKCSSVLLGKTDRATVFSQTRGTDQVLSRIYELALKNKVIAPQDFRSFRDAAIANPLNNLFGVIEALDEMGAPVAKIAHFERELNKIIANIRAPGMPIQGLRYSNSLFLKELPIEIQKIYGGMTAHFYKKIRTIKVASFIFNVPEYSSIGFDSTTKTIRLHEEGAGRELLNKIIEVGQSPKWANRTAFILMDLNGLGITNTFRNGLSSGDQYLRQYAEVVQEHLAEDLRNEDLFFRYAGDEFIIVMSDVSAEEVQKIMQRLSDRIYMSEKVNEVYLHEKQVLVEIKKHLNDVQNISDLEGLAFEHEGLRDLMQALATKDISFAVKEVGRFIDYNFSKLDKMKTGISTGIIMMNKGGSLAEYVTLASRQLKTAKSIYYFINAPESEYDSKKYDLLTPEQRALYAHRHGHNVMPIVLEPLVFRANE